MKEAQSRLPRMLGQGGSIDLELGPIQLMGNPQHVNPYIQLRLYSAYHSPNGESTHLYMTEISSKFARSQVSELDISSLTNTQGDIINKFISHEVIFVDKAGPEAYNLSINKDLNRAWPK